ncbi:MAG: adenylate/guanylate cyclase domain-containing protein [Limnobacter sp.]|uniref:adenylate/guanylate cyclase domain-containing protein n=1 Tax=Limnobacter sp. TaxID=2003368 RepID=UPI0022C6D1CC|nr:adenylate/guanylate cyclase domain-containing protein [Limnobacter sp.]MCZ8014117.1 adenylate/guanylate cyclase domain-containing protein [Limnobacter sp.]
MYTHKNLTVMFTDICGFTRQTSISSRNDMMARLEIHNALLTPVIRQWGGTIVKSIGDAFLLTFESPTDALHCAICLQHALHVHNHEAPEQTRIHIKISVNCGEVAVTDTDVFGDPVNVAAKIEKATTANEIYFTEAVYLAMNQSEVPCEFASTFAAKGDAAPEIRLYRILTDDKNPRYQGILSTGADKRAAHIVASMPMSAKPAKFKRHWKVGLLVAVALFALAGLSVLFGKPKAVQIDTNTADPLAGTSASPDQAEQFDPNPQPVDSRKSRQAATMVWATAIVQDPAQLKEKAMR